MPTLAERMAERQRRLAQREKANDVADSLSEAVHLRLQYERRLQVRGCSCKILQLLFSKQTFGKPAKFGRHLEGSFSAENR